MPSEPEHPHANVNDRAKDELVPILRALDERIELSEHEHAMVSGALASAILAGVRIGVAEAVAQAAEHGVNVELHMDIRDYGPDEWGEP